MIDGMKADFPIRYLCGKFGVSESGFHAWRRRPQSATAARFVALQSKVLGIFTQTKRSVGHRKITTLLERQYGVRVDRKTVLKSMRASRLMPLETRAAFRKYATRKAHLPDPGDLVERRFTATTPGAVLVGDITYVPTQQGWLYVATVIDLATRMVLGCASSKHPNAELVVTAIQRAKRTGLITPDAIFHSDHGGQYRAHRFRAFCERNGIRRSMGAKFQCFDNAVAEAFFSRLKNERLRWNTFTSRAEATAEVADYVRYYNTVRPHQTLGQRTPLEALQATTAAHAA